MIENEEQAPTSTSLSSTFPSSSGKPDSSLNTTTNTNDGFADKTKANSYVIPKSPSTTDTNGFVAEDIIQISDSDTEMDLDLENSTIASASSPASNNKSGNQDLETGASMPQENGKNLHGINGMSTITPTSGSVTEVPSRTALSQRSTSPISASAPDAPSITSELGQSSSTKTDSTIEHRRTRARSDSRSLSPSTVRQSKKAMQSSTSSALETRRSPRITISSPIDSPKLTPPPTRILRHLLPTGYIYDVFMSYHATLDTFDIHPEDPRRIFFIYREMMCQKLLDHCERIPIRKATQQDILAVHELDLLKALAKTKDMTRKELMDMENSNDSIYVNKHSYEASLYAAGGVMELCKAVFEDKIKNGFAIVRPPGHHAESDVSMGFCFINNVAIATQYCLQQLKLKKIMIVDWDVHFGNGTHQIFANNPNVLYLSIHRYNDGAFYPGYDNGGVNTVGDAPAEGRSVNIPWPNEGATDDDYIYAFHQVVMPIGYEFQPDLLIVSAGFDAADGDDIGMCKVSPAGFSNMTHLLKGLANGRMVMALEGGYNLKATSISATACMSVLMGEAPLPLNIGIPSKDATTTIEKVKAVQSKYWRSLRR